MMDNNTRGNVEYGRFWKAGGGPEYESTNRENSSPERRTPPGSGRRLLLTTRPFPRNNLPWPTSELAFGLWAFGWTLPSLSFLLGAGVVPKHPNAEPAQPTGVPHTPTHDEPTTPRSCVRRGISIVATSATNEYDCHNTTTTTTHPHQSIPPHLIRPRQT